MESSPQNEGSQGSFRTFFKSALQAIALIALVALPATGLGYVFSELFGFPLVNSIVMTGGLGVVLGGVGYLAATSSIERNKH